jgi:Ca2+-binding RTX toxin-like protein
VICGRSGDDRIIGQDGNDTIYAGARDDKVSGGRGADTILADGGNDVVYGGRHGDSINGGAGSDVLVGTGGEDTLDDAYSGVDECYQDERVGTPTDC